jgi:glycosyltransferase involved in cell wall biosynthesis
MALNDRYYAAAFSDEGEEVTVMTYSKRIAFLVSSQTLIPHGGIGQFTKSFCDLMDSYGIYVDIITDKSPRGVSDEFVKELKANIIYPDDPQRYTDHSAIFMYEDSYCYERMANFRDATIKALSNNLYDAFICNTYETIQVVSTLGLTDYIQTIAYTHLESQIFKDTKNPFLDEVNDMMRLQLQVSNLTIGTQSLFNKLHFDGAVHLPIPLPEKALLREYDNDREGVLFIGRWEEGKNPELYLDLIEQTGLPARVMTNSNGAKKFEDRLKKLGVDYKIAVSIIGQEKVDFIKNCRVAFNPSTVESYGIAFLEQIIQLPTFALINQRWTKNFPSTQFFTTSKRNMAEDVKAVYEQYPTSKSWYAAYDSVNHFKLHEDAVFHKWNHCFNEFEPRKSNNNTAKICDETTVKYSDFVSKLGRRILCIDDIRSVLANRHKFRVMYTEKDTYLTKDPTFEPNEELFAESLFEF